MNVQEVLENYNVYKLRISITSSEIQEIQAEIYDTLYLPVLDLFLDCILLVLVLLFLFFVYSF